MTDTLRRPLATGALATLAALAALAPPALAVPTVPATPAADAEEAPPLDTAALATRHHQLKLHQAVALTTLGVMAVTAGLGYASSRGLLPVSVREPHIAAAGLSTGLYLATATLALTTPPSPLGGEAAAWDTVGLHRNLGWLHMAGMAGTVGLGLANILGPGNMTTPHGLAGYATLGLMATSAAIVAFGE
jgi:hypothetical protein